MAESNRIVHSQDAKLQTTQIATIKSTSSTKPIPLYITEFLKLKANNHTDVFLLISQYFKNIIPRYRYLTRNYVVNNMGKKSDFARWLARKGDIYLFDIHAFHNVYVSSENSHPTTGVHSIINLSLCDPENINSVHIFSFVVSNEFFYQSDLEELKILREILNDINPNNINPVSLERAISPRLNDICVPSTMSLDNRIYRFYDSLSRDLQSIETRQIVSTFNELKTSVKKISDVNTDSLSVFFEMLKNIEYNYVSDLSRDPAYVEMLDKIFYIKKFLQTVIRERYIINSGLPDCCVIHESVRELNNALVRHDQERYKLMKECQMMEECQTNANCQSR